MNSKSDKNKDSTRPQAGTFTPRRDACRIQSLDKRICSILSRIQTRQGQHNRVATSTTQAARQPANSKAKRKNRRWNSDLPLQTTSWARWRNYSRHGLTNIQRFNALDMHIRTANPIFKCWGELLKLKPNSKKSFPAYMASLKEHPAARNPIKGERRNTLTWRENATGAVVLHTAPANTS